MKVITEKFEPDLCCCFFFLPFVCVTLSLLLLHKWSTLAKQKSTLFVIIIDIKNSWRRSNIFIEVGQILSYVKDILVGIHISAKQLIALQSARQSIQ